MEFREAEQIVKNVIGAVASAEYDGIMVKRLEASNTLDGKTFVVSGTFSQSRDEIKKLIELNGGKNVSSISSKLNYLLAGNKMGPEKRKKAEQFNIPIINELEFMTMISAKDSSQITENIIVPIIEETKTNISTKEETYIQGSLF